MQQLHMQLPTASHEEEKHRDSDNKLAWSAMQTQVASQLFTIGNVIVSWLGATIGDYLSAQKLITLRFSVKWKEDHFERLTHIV